MGGETEPAGEGSMNTLGKFIDMLAPRLDVSLGSLTLDRYWIEIGPGPVHRVKVRVLHGGERKWAEMEFTPEGIDQWNWKYLIDECIYKLKKELT